MLACSILSARVKRFGKVPVDKHSAFNCQVVLVFTVTQFVNAEDHYVPGTYVSMEDASTVMGDLMGYNVRTVRLGRQTAEKWSPYPSGQRILPLPSP